MTDSELDESLREAMRARPVPIPAVNLASIAMDRARRAAVQRVRRWTAAANALTSVIVVAVVAMFVRARLASGGFSAWSDGSVTAVTSSTPPWLLIAAAIVMGAIAVVAARSAWDTADDGIRWAA